MRRVLAPIALIAALAALAPATAAARVVDCATWVHYPNTKISSARNMSCRGARNEMRRYRSSIKRRFTTPGRFRCARVSGGALGGQWRCVNGSRAFRLEVGD